MSNTDHQTDPLETDVIAVAEKHRDGMKYLIVEYGSSCVAFGKSLETGTSSAQELQRMSDLHRDLQDRLDSLVDLARSYF